MLALVGVLGLYWLQLHESHTRMRAQVKVDTQRLAGQTAHALALQMNTVVRKLDYFSRHLSWVWLQGDVAAFHDASRVATDALTSETLAQIAVADAQGRILYSNLNWGAAGGASQPSVSIADREHFRVHLGIDQPFLFISDPIKGRISQKRTIQFTRGLFKGGELVGVMVLAVSAEHLAAFLKAIFPDSIDAASLIKHNGIYLARSSYLSEVLGKALPSSRPFLLHPELDQGTYEVLDIVDGLQRFYSWRRVEGYPLVVLVGLGADQAMALMEESIRDSHWQNALASMLLMLAGLSLSALWAQRTLRAMDVQQVVDALAVETLRLNTMLERFPGGVLIQDTDGQVVFANALWSELLDLTPGDGGLKGMQGGDLMGMLAPEMAAWLEPRLASAGSGARHTREITTAHGRFLEIDHINISQNGQYLGSLCLLRDITDRKQYEQQLTQLASTDTLTGLLNRRSFMHGIHSLYAALLQGKAHPGVVMMLDIDRFKQVNDTYGHATGDVVLTHIAHLIQSSVRATDMPGRYGGEEFVVLQPHTSLQEGLATAERIRRQVEDTPVHVEGQEIRVTISIGVAMVSASHTPEQALQLADQAMYAAKNAGRNRVCLAEGLMQGE